MLGWGEGQTERRHVQQINRHGAGELFKMMTGISNGSVAAIVTSLVAAQKTQMLGE